MLTCLCVVDQFFKMNWVCDELQVVLYHNAETTIQANNMHLHIFMIFMLLFIIRVPPVLEIFESL